MKKISSVIFSIALICCFLPIRVFADSGTYYEYTNLNTFIHVFDLGTNDYFFKADNNCRTVVLKNSNGNGAYFYAVFTMNGVKALLSSNNSGTLTQVNTYVTENNVRYYVYVYNLGSFTINNSIIPIVEDSNYSSNSRAVYFTYGDGSVDPVPEINYGDLINLGYNTKIAGSGDAAINNLDTITWNPEQDANGNDISDMNVTIRAVPGKYSAQSSQSILEQLYSNFVLDTLHVSELETVNASDGSFSISVILFISV